MTTIHETQKLTFKNYVYEESYMVIIFQNYSLIILVYLSIFCVLFQKKLMN